MKTLYIFIIILTVSISAQEIKRQDEGRQTNSLAILPFTNHNTNFGQIANTIPDMLISELVGVPHLQLVERGRVEQAQTAISIENEKFNSTQNQLKIGQWLGAEYLMLGSFTQLGKNLRLDMRIIDVKSGSIPFATSVEGPEHKISDLITELGNKARNALSGDLKKPQHSIASIPNELSDIPTINRNVKVIISLQLKLGLFTTRNFPIQKIRLYVDGKLIIESEPINQFNRTWNLFEVDLPVGNHSIELSHGMIDRKGRWVSALDSQPMSQTLLFEDNRALKINYSQTVFNNEVVFSQLRFN